MTLIRRYGICFIGMTSWYPRWLRQSHSSWIIKKSIRSESTHTSYFPTYHDSLRARLTLPLEINFYNITCLIPHTKVTYFRSPAPHHRLHTWKGINGIYESGGVVYMQPICCLGIEHSYRFSWKITLKKTTGFFLIALPAAIFYQQGYEKHRTRKRKKREMKKILAG